MPDRPRIVGKRQAGRDHRVVTVKGGRGDLCRREPCGGCPWRIDQTGAFPADAFRHSANTAYDMSTHVFACHESGAEKPTICAGFLLRGATHNLSVRLKLARGLDIGAIHDGGHQLHPNCRTMAVANGLPTDHPSLRLCRDD